MPAASAVSLPQSLLDQPAVQWLHERLASRTRAAFVRLPLADPECPTMNDLDIVAFGDVESFRPERLRAPDGTAVDLAWYPAGLLGAPQKLAVSGLAAHRLMVSSLLWDHAGDAPQQCAAFDACLHEAAIQSQRIAVFLDMGYLTVREIGVTWDFPALARFWLQMGFAGCVAAMADACGLAAPNVFTRPFGHIETIERISGLAIRACLVDSLRLGAEPAALVAPLRRLHRRVAERFSHPDWPASMRQVTRAEYAYTLPAGELEWRIGVALEMAAQGQTAAAVFYLRFWAYSLARLPMVWHSAAEGRDIAFLRPERPVLPSLLALCPEIVCDLDAILGGPGDDIRGALDQLLKFRQVTLDLMSSRGVMPPLTPEWRPHRSASPALQPC
jgi:hypothetical protein